MDASIFRPSFFASSFANSQRSSWQRVAENEGRKMKAGHRHVFVACLLLAALFGMNTRVCAGPERREASLATVGLTPGWATFGQTLPQGAAFEALQVGSLRTQTDVKTRWPDGSIRFAVLSAKVVQAGTYPVRPVAVVKDKGRLEAISAEVRFTNDADGLMTAAMSSKTAPDSMWLDGPLVTEGRWSVVPIDGAGKKQSGLRVLFDQRCYHDGARRLAVTVENADDTLENQPRKLVVQIFADVDRDGTNDERLFERAGLTMGSGTRFIRRFVGGLTASVVTPDFESAFRSGALPRFAASVSDQIASPLGPTGKLRRTFDLLGPGDLNPYMGSPGGRPEIGVYTEWTARYLVHRQPKQAEYLLRMADLAASWPVHIREPSDGRLVSLKERPKFWFDSRGEDHARSAAWGGSPLIPDNAHVPGGLVFVPYLLTGDRFYADEMSFWANYGVLSTWPGNSSSDDSSQSGGDASAGPGRGVLATNQVRGFAWALRNLCDAAAYLPDSDPIKPELNRIVRENLAWLDDWARAHVGPLKMAWLPGYGTETDATHRFAQLWMYDYLAWSIHRAQQLGFSGGTRFRDQVVRFQTELFLNPDYDSEYAAPGRLMIGEIANTTGATRYFESLSDVLKATSRQHSRGVFTGYYGPKARMMFLIGIETDADGRNGDRDRCTAALRNLNDPKRHPGMFDDPLIRSGFGLAGPDHPAP